MDITIDYKLLEPYSRDRDNVTLIVDKNLEQLNNLIRSTSLTVIVGTITFWTEITNIPEDLGFYTNWALVRVLASLAGKPLLTIEFPGHSVLGKWIFESPNTYPSPLPEALSNKATDIEPLLVRIAQVLKEIEKDTRVYNEYVLDNLPLLYREGTLSLEDYYRICPESRIKLTTEEKETILSSPPHTIYSNLTLRTYLRVFVKVHSSMFRMDPKKYGGDLEYYENITGETLGALYPKLDSPATFKQFSNSSILKGNLFDLVYRKVCLVPQAICPVDDYPDKNLWRIFIHVIDKSYLDLALKGYLGAIKEVLLMRQPEIFDMIQHKGLVRLTSNPSESIHTTTSLRGLSQDIVYIESLYPLDSPERMKEVERLIKLEPLHVGLFNEAEKAWKGNVNLI